MADYPDFLNTFVMGCLEMLMGFWFFTGFLQRKGKPIYSILSAAFGMAVPVIFNLQGISALLVFIILLMAAGKLLYREDFVSAALYAVVTVEIMALCFGLSNSLSYILFPVVFQQNPGMYGFIFAWAGNTFAFLLAFLCYRVIQRCCICGETTDRKYVFIILMPVLSIFLASEYINENVYGNTVTIEKGGLISGVNPYQMLLMQAHSLEGYVEEAKLRYEKTRSFRHDIKNHITVVKELLEKQMTEAALQYVEEMENLTTDLSFPVSTNHPVLDILLGNKLGIARENGIEIECSLAVPYPCGISDIDFCIILGNALDNAISACGRIGGGKQKYIHVTGKVQGDLLLMEIENSYSGRRIIGLYRMVQDENGDPKVLYDDPKKADGAGGNGESGVRTNGSEKDKEAERHKLNSDSTEKDAEKCTTNTDKTDREIKKLKEQKQQLEQQIKAASGDEEKVKELKKKLSRIEGELNRKDNDTYRRQNAVIS